VRRALYVLAMLSSVLLSSLVSCSSEPLERLASVKNETVRELSEGLARQLEETTEAPPPEPRAYLVPVAHLTSPLEKVTLKDLSRDHAPAVPRGLREPLAGLLDEGPLKPFASAEAIVEHVSRTPGAVGLVPWQDVDPRVKVLALGESAPLGPGSAPPEDYPLALGDASPPEPEKLRRLVLAGDVVLDRGLPYAVYQLGGGPGFPLEGGYAAVTWRRAVPSEFSEFGVIHEFRAERLGGSGAVREYLEGADLALANLENPVLKNAVWHPEGTTFHGDLRLFSLLEKAGVDGVTLANNHVLDAGVPGLSETLGHLDRAGIAHAGAGMDLNTAREPMVFDLGGVKVGVLNYQNVPSYEWAWAAEGTPGTAPLEIELVQEDIARLKPKVDVVVVMPHWGNEYTATPEPGQVDLAHQMVEAGADLVVGGHAHWAKGVEVYREKPVFYGVGNFLFDQVWSEETSTGVFAEVTLYEDRVVQARPVPFVVLDYAQPNFLVPEAGGDRALQRIYTASLGPEFESYRAAADPE
jgi:poly-gamma-glutamate capsule biosynthesis protein CapA/YwtB (metallophosphatase superfamily)